MSPRDRILAELSQRHEPIRGWLLFACSVGRSRVESDQDTRLEYDAALRDLIAEGLVEVTYGDGGLPSYSIMFPPAPRPGAD